MLRTIARVRALPYSPETFEGALSESDNAGDLAAAVAFLVRNRMSRNALGTAFARPGAGTRRLRGSRHPDGPLPDNESAWRSFVEALPALARRLQAVELVEGDAVALIRRHDRPGTLIYCDPPYVPTTRTARKA